MSEYRTPQALRAALEVRQRKRAEADGVPFDRVAQVDLYFRLLDRLLQNVDGIVVKGGVALELRLGRARTTRDVDIRAAGNPARILERLRQAGQRDHGDYLAFQIDERAGAETIDGDGVVYEGRRFRVTARFAGKPYRQPFGSMAIVATTLREALEATFAFRGTHPVPATCPPPPASWAARYPRERELNGLPWPRIEDVHAEVARFLDPVLAKATAGVWVPARTTWM